MYTSWCLDTILHFHRIKKTKKDGDIQSGEMGQSCSKGKNKRLMA